MNRMDLAGRTVGQPPQGGLLTGRREERVGEIIMQIAAGNDQEPTWGR